MVLVAASVRQVSVPLTQEITNWARMYDAQAATSAPNKERPLMAPKRPSNLVACDGESAVKADLESKADAVAPSLAPSDGHAVVPGGVDDIAGDHTCNIARW